jgi:hypothetical protein
MLHRLSAKAPGSAHASIPPLSGISLQRAGGGAGVDEVRRIFRHESLVTTLRYSSLVGADLRRAHRRAGAIERLRVE